MIPVRAGTREACFTMNISFRMLDKKDRKKAIDFAVVGMHCNVYFGSDFMSSMYGRFLLYFGMTSATQMIAAYEGDKFLGLLLARIDGEERCCHSLFLKAFTGTANLISRIFSRNGAGVYETACREMLTRYKKENSPDGEMTFFAVDPKEEGKGIGTAILDEFERRESGKLVYLNTDDQCTWQFYDHRGFMRVGEKDIVMDLKEKVPLKCMLYSKKID